MLCFYLQLFAYRNTIMGCNTAVKMTKPEPYVLIWIHLKSIKLNKKARICTAGHYLYKVFKTETIFCTYAIESQPRPSSSMHQYVLQRTGNV